MAKPRKPGVVFDKASNVGRRVAQSTAHRTAVEAVAFVVEREAKKRAPVDTGRLRNSIGTEVTVRPNGITAEIGTNVEYAAAQEFGTSRVPAKRYLGGALRAAGALLQRRR